jgi:quinol monooxygenase YgiN
MTDIVNSTVALGELNPQEVSPLAEQSRVLPIREDQQRDQSCIHASIRIVIPAKKRKEVLIILNSIIEQTKLEEACISCRLYRDVQEDRAFMLEEIWSSEKDLQRHLNSDKFHTVLLVVEMATEPPEIRFDTIAHSSGIETIEKARNHT